MSSAVTERDLLVPYELTLDNSCEESGIGNPPTACCRLPAQYQPALPRSPRRKLQAPRCPKCSASGDTDSPVEGDGFEPSVPGTKEPVFIAEGELRDRTGAAKKGCFLCGTDGSNPSPSRRQSVSRGIFPSCIENPAVAAACAGPARRHGRQRRAGPANITPTAGKVSVGPYFSTAAPARRFATVVARVRQARSG
jgi:hypothetical protein